MKKLLKFFGLALALCLLFGMTLASAAHEDDEYALIHKDCEGNELVIDTNPTCTTAGLGYRQCKVDPTKAHPETIPALGHDWSSEDFTAGALHQHWGDVITEPTCTNPGKAVNICLRCKVRADAEGVTMPTGVPVYRDIDKLPHTWGVVPDVYPTCLGGGKLHEECAVCGVHKDLNSDGKLDEKDFYDKKTVDQFLELLWITEEQAIAKGYLKSEDGHDWTAYTTKAATCWREGYKTRICKLCNSIENNFVSPRLEPKWVKVENMSQLLNCRQEYAVYRCSLCNGKDENGTELKYWEWHGTHGAIVPVKAHVYDKTKKVTSTAATCETAGENVYDCIYAKESKTEYQFVERIDPHTDPHNPENGIDTWKTDGKIKHTTDDYLHEKVDALGHDWSEWVRVVDPTDKDKTSGWSRSCLRDGCTKGEQVADENRPVCANNKHSADSKEVTVPHTCTEDGYTGKKCSICGYVWDRKPNGDKADHAWDNSKTQVLVAATCTEAGESLKYCTVCEKNILVAGKTPEGHKYEDVDAVAATCVKDGHEKGQKCTVCGFVNATVIKATGVHKYEKVIEGKAPTCTTTGLNDGTACTECGKVGLAQKEIPALGHDIKVLPAKAATCTETGLTEGKDCSRCDDATVEVKQEVVPAKGHTWDAGVITTEATPTTDGVKTFTCTVCKETKTEKVAYVFGDEAVYTLTNMGFSNNKITGTAVHDATTVESDKLYARVTVFFNGGTYAVFADYVEDGVIDIEVQGVVLAVSVNLTGNKNLAPGEDMKVFDSWGNYSK